MSYFENEPKLRTIPNPGQGLAGARQGAATARKALVACGGISTGADVALRRVLEALTQLEGALAAAASSGTEDRGPTSEWFLQHRRAKLGEQLPPNKNRWLGTDPGKARRPAELVERDDGMWPDPRKAGL
jgi:hypothetical protein